MNRSNHRFLPILSLLVTATLWGLVWYPLRRLDAHGMGGLWASLVSYAGALLLGSGWLWRSRADWRESGMLLALMALGVGWCNVAFVLAVLDGTVVRVLLLFYLSPLWAVILGWLLLGEHPGYQGLVVFVLAIAGAATMLWDPAIGLPWPRGDADWLAVSSGFAFAFANVMVRKMRAVSLQSKSAANWLGVVLVAGAWILAASEPVPVVSYSVWAGAVLLGWFGFLIMTVTVIYGVTHMPLYRSAVILLFELVVGAVSALLLTDEQVLPREWLGGALILTAAYLTAHAQVGESK
ncbi:MAG: DMT family transporter [Thiogranum sp.]|jgi:drug/metabolite transporter (DMT)-like permease|nr:DMT family transporter [Thiogranum sp.]